MLYFEDPSSPSNININKYYETCFSHTYFRSPVVWDVVTLIFSRVICTGQNSSVLIPIYNTVVIYYCSHAIMTTNHDGRRYSSSYIIWLLLYIRIVVVVIVSCLSRKRHQITQYYTIVVNNSFWDKIEKIVIR